MTLNNKEALYMYDLKKKSHYNVILNRIKNLFGSTMWKACLITSIIYLLLNSFAYARFDNDVDIMISGLLNNAAGTRGTSHVGFSSVFIMKPIQWLIKNNPSVAWYTWILIVCAGISITILNWILLNRRDDKQFIIILSVFNIFIGYEVFMFPSYLKVSIFGTFSMGMLLLRLINYVNYKKWHISVPILGIILFGLLSFTGFLLGSIAAAFVWIVYSIFNKNYKCFVVEAVIFMAAFLVLFNIRLYEKNYLYNSSEELYIENEYIDDVERLIIFGYPEYQDSFEKDYGISEHEYRIISEGNYFFVKNRTVDNLSFIQGISDSNINITWKNILSFFRIVPISLIKVGYTFLLLFVVFWFLSSDNYNKNKILFIMLGYMLMVYLIAFFNFAWNNKMIQMIVFVPLVFYLMMNIPLNSDVTNRDLIIYLILTFVILYNNFSEMIVRNISEDEIREVINSKVEDSDRVSVINIDSICRQCSIYKSQDKDLLKYDNLVLTNGYYSLFTEYDHNQYFSHQQDEYLWVNGEEEIYVYDYYVCE